MANALATLLNKSSSPVTAVVTAGGTATSASVKLTTKATGADQNGPITLRLVSQVKAAAASLAGVAGTTYDTGTVTATVNGTGLTTTYGQTSTPLTVTQALASAINAANLGVAATAAAPGSLTVTASLPGTADNGLPVTLSSASDEPKFFSSPSFSGTSGTLSGGVAGSTTPGTVYSYAIAGSTTKAGDIRQKPVTDGTFTRPT